MSTFLYIFSLGETKRIETVDFSMNETHGHLDFSQKNFGKPDKLKKQQKAPADF